MQNLISQNIRCIIMTSGTMAPIESFIKEMEIKCPIKLSNIPHIIKPSQVFVKVLTHGSDDIAFDSRFKNK